MVNSCIKFRQFLKYAKRMFRNNVSIWFFIVLKHGGTGIRRHRDICLLRVFVPLCLRGSKKSEHTNRNRDHVCLAKSQPSGTACSASVWFEFCGGIVGVDEVVLHDEKIPPFIIVINVFAALIPAAGISLIGLSNRRTWSFPAARLILTDLLGKSSMHGSRSTIRYYLY